ncbi:hypothetical protein EK21DRAFT_53761 [Setomelanomma holmii]|uniref:Restriction of telomere capping protein 4 n=1 Tax=Setomelanomma holmii TaxID=210430 RepID=A0A9P4HMW1_9PLEO|nr:hypothetical protein EK21DRAFT_53761 [Setomelanomma holmii]
MPPLSRATSGLLRTVGGLPHASDDDHEESQRKRYAEDEELAEPQRKRRRSLPNVKGQVEEDINAEPQSSDEEIRKPEPRPSRAPLPITSAPNSDDELKAPQRKSTRNHGDSTTRKVAAKKAAERRVEKEREEDKENTSLATPQSSSISSQNGGFVFGMEHSSQQLTKRTFSKAKTFSSRAPVKNIHQAPEKKSKKRKSLKAPAIALSQAHGGGQIRTKKETSHDDEMGSDCSMEDEQVIPEQQPDPELRKRELKKRPQRTARNSNSTLNDDEFDEAPRRKKPRNLYDQLGNWQKDQALGSSPPASSAPQEDMDNLKNYIEQLPGEEEENFTCPICRIPVTKNEYWDFWGSKDNTVRNQNAFCRSHRTKSAWDEYRSEGYPDINWSALPQRIRKHRMELFKILNNDRPSEYRDRYKPIALTGKAASVPSRRKDLPGKIQEELDSYAIDDQTTYPGYYGPHGRRIITENVMKILKNEIKNCSDAVVQGSGPATFVQAVLVPETAILLIMEDCRVDREDAEEIREKTYDMGMLLNEEIEDQVEAYPSDDENEYVTR